VLRKQSQNTPQCSKQKQAPKSTSNQMGHTIKLAKKKVAIRQQIFSILQRLEGLTTVSTILVSIQSQMNPVHASYPISSRSLLPLFSLPSMHFIFTEATMMRQVLNVSLHLHQKQASVRYVQNLRFSQRRILKSGL
jgi:hypothetical protein